MHATAERTNPSTWTNVWRVFSEPMAVMESLSFRWNWFPAWLTAVILTAVTQVPALLRYVAHVEEVVASGQVLEQVAKVEMWLTIANNTLNPPLNYLVQAGMAGAILSFLGAISYTAPQGFSRWFSVAMWAALPAATGAAVFKALALAIYAGPPKMYFAGPAVLMPEASRGVVMTLLVSLDIFSLWSVGLCAVGAYALNQRRTKPAIVAGFAMFLYNFLINSLTWY